MPVRDEAQLIRLCRVLCIFFMMYVHVSPGLSHASIVSGGELTWLGDLLGHILGRASVATLSLVSGYLLIRTAASMPISLIARRRFRTLLVPMLVWNLIYYLLLLAKAGFSGTRATAALQEDGNDLLALLTGLTGPTANLSLFFLRDLFVSLIIVRLLVPWLRRFPIPIIAGVCGATLLDLLEPVVFRPSILLFVCAGAIYALKANHLTAWLAPKVLGPSGAALAVGLFLIQKAQGPVAAEAESLMLRALLTLGTLTLCARLAKTGAGGWLAEFELRIFETYLVHASLIGILWLIWSTLVGGPHDFSYVVFFLGMPLVSIMGGQILGAFLDRAPGMVQMLFRGKSRDALRQGRSGP
jgi:hypothetical protein